MKKILFFLIFLFFSLYGDIYFPSPKESFEEYKNKCNIERIPSLKNSERKYFFEDCGYLGYHYESGQGTPKDLKKAVYFYKIACENGSYAYCNTLANLYREGNGIKRNLKKAYQLYKIACEKIEGRETNSSCLLIETMCLSGEITSKKHNECKEISKDYQALGLAYYNGFNSKKMLKKAAYFFKKSCSKKNGAGCYMLGELYDKSKHKQLEYDPQQSFNFFSKACDYNHHYGCERALRLLRINNLNLESSKKATYYMEKACAGNIYEECENAADVYLSQKESETGKILNFYKKACKGLKDKWNYKNKSCLKAGRIMVDSAKTKSIYQESTFFLKEACKDKMSEGCRYLGLLYFEGKGVSKNWKKAIKYFKKGCEQKDKLSCDYYYKIWDKGYLP